MKKIFALLAILCWQTAFGQKSPFTWGLQVATFPGVQVEEEDFSATTSTSPATGSANVAQQNPLLMHCIDPGFVVSWENPKTFHNLVFNPLSLTVTNLNIIIGKHFDYYCFVSYAPRENLWFPTIGGSKTFEIKGGGEITPYIDWGCENFDPHFWLIEVGVVYGLQLGPIQFKNKHHKNNKSIRRDHS